MRVEIEAKRDHLFISYAIEQAALAEWLTLKLTAEGYAAWCDRVKLLDGESYPKAIDKAIKERSFRLIGILSPESLGSGSGTPLNFPSASSPRYDLDSTVTMGRREVDQHPR